MKLLFIAYKIEKDKGSEDGTGYNIAKLLAKEDIDLTIITRQNNIDKLQNDPEFANIRFIPVEVPKALSFYKKKERGVIPYYYLWQIFVGLKIYQLQKSEQFDIIHQFNFHASWAPHFIFSKAKIIWGPLTHHASIPFSFWKNNKTGYLKEILRRLIKKFFFTIDPFVKWAIQRSEVIFFGYKDYVGSYSKSRHKLFLLPQARTVFPVISSKNNTNNFNILFVGRFITLKGCITAIHAIERMLNHLPVDEQRQINFTMIGEGNLQPELYKAAERIANATYSEIRIIDWVNQPELSDYYQQASLLLFPSFEGQGLVVTEALAHGCPILCLEDTGPAFLGGQAAITVPKNDFEVTVSVLSLQLEHLLKEYWHKPEIYQQRIDKALKRAHDLTWEKKAAVLLEHYYG